MSEIEKMYENAGVKSFKSCEFCQHKNVDCLKEIISNKTCGYSKDVYPPFTAEKQIAVIKILAKGEVKINNEDGEYEFSDVDVVSDFSSFEESLADFTNRVWQDLIAEEKQQVKGILE